MGKIKSGRDAAIADLADILAWARPHDSEAERRFCREYLDTVPGMTADGFGNRMIRVGPEPQRVLWSCHVDTVARQGGRQALTWIDSDTLGLLKGKPGQSLGADDGVGVWIMLDMIAAGRPGLYVFHRGEEQGCLGSSYIARFTPDLLDGIEAAIAFDRAGYRDVITHQMGKRTASDAFALSFAAQVNELAGLELRPDDGGVYTDTREYEDIVPECTNISVGYFGQHGPRETLDATFALLLRDAMLAFDTDKLVIERNPEPETREDQWASWRKAWDCDNDDDDPNGPRPYTGMDLEELCEAHPEIAAKMLADYGLDEADFLDELLNETPASPPYRPVAAS